MIVKTRFKCRNCQHYQDEPYGARCKPPSCQKCMASNMEFIKFVNTKQPIKANLKNEIGPI